MNKQRYVIPEGMLRAAKDAYHAQTQDGVDTMAIRGSLEAAFRWLGDKGFTYLIPLPPNSRIFLLTKVRESTTLETSEATSLMENENDEDCEPWLYQEV